MKQPDQNLPITPELYQRTLERLALKTVCLDTVKSSCAREVAHDGQVDVILSAEAQDYQTEGQYLAFITYRLSGKRDEYTLLELEAKYRIVFDMPEPVPSGFFEVFRELNLRITTMPYFRELIASITGRMEIPTLTLPYAIYAGPFGEPEELEASKSVDNLTKRRARKPATAKA